MILLIENEIISTACEFDILWDKKQVELQQSGHLNALDIEHIADEIDDEIKT